MFLRKLANISSLSDLTAIMPSVVIKHKPDWTSVEHYKVMYGIKDICANTFKLSVMDPKDVNPLSFPVKLTCVERPNFVIEYGIDRFNSLLRRQAFALFIEDAKPAPVKVKQLYGSPKQ